MKRMGHQVLPEELAAIVRRLDIDGDAKITYEEFVEALSPVSPDLLPVHEVTASRDQLYLDQKS